MKKFCLRTVFTLIIISIFFLSGCATTIKIEKKPEKATNSSENQDSSSTVPVREDTTAVMLPSQQEENGTTETFVQEGTEKEENKEADNMGNALFIGDSRTVGLMEYSDLKADFYASEGMSVYNLNKKPISVPKVGKVRLDALLSQKSYDKIYLMLGINESGYEFNTTVKKYEEVVTFIQEKQPNAKIIIQANLHVTKKRSESDAVYNNSYINRFNREISKLADDKKIFYLDVNSLFDDAEGNLSADKSEDEVHVFAKYYMEWGNWIKRETSLKVEGV